jgi:anti-anti-sigma factor
VGTGGSGVCSGEPRTPVSDRLNRLAASILAAVHPGEITVERSEPGVVVISLEGEHDLSTAPALREQLEEVLREGAPIVVSLSGAEFIDSSIIGVVLDVQRRAEEAGTGFAAALEDGAPAVQRVLQITGLDSNLPVRGSEREAIETAGAGREGGDE